MTEVWVVFDPKHPRRVEQTLERLWVEDSTLLVERGVCLREWELVERRELGSARAARSELERRLADARGRGLAIESDDVSVIARLSTRHVELEGLLAAVGELHSAEGRELLQVYGDYLQSEGDPRGLLASLQLRNLDARPWFAEHMAWCFGRFAGLVQRSNKEQSKLIGARWFGGWITHLWLYVPGRFSDGPTPELAELLRLPACASLRRLMAPSQRLPDAPELACRASLRWLSTAGFSSGALELGELPRLEHLTLHRCPRSLDVRAPCLRSLGFSGAGVTAIAELLDSGSVGPLERLECELPREDGGTAGQLRVLLRLGALGSLRGFSLSRRRPRYSDRNSPLREAVLEVLCVEPLLRRLELRDFTGLTLQGEQRERLLAAFASVPGRTVA